MAPKVSVIIPTYNRLPVLKSALQSVFDQTFGDFEVIIVDDSSTDGTVAYVLGLSDPRIRLFQHSENQGAGAARNTGLDRATGKYIAFLDSDDLYLPVKLEKQVAYLEQHPEVDLVYGAWSLIDAHGNIAIDLVEPISEAGLIPLLFLNHIATVSPLFRRSCLDSNIRMDSSLRLAQDWDFWIALANEGCVMGYDPVRVVKYRLYDGNRSSAAEPIREADFRVIGKWFSEGRLPLELAVLRPAAYASRHAHAACREFDAGLIETAQADVQAALDYEMEWQETLSSLPEGDPLTPYPILCARRDSWMGRALMLSSIYLFRGGHPQLAAQRLELATSINDLPIIEFRSRIVDSALKIMVSDGMDAAESFLQSIIDHVPAVLRSTCRAIQAQFFAHLLLNRLGSPDPSQRRRYAWQAIKGDPNYLINRGFVRSCFFAK